MKIDITKIVTEVLENEETQKLFEERLQNNIVECIKSSLDDIFRWNSPTKDKINEQIKKQIDKEFDVDHEWFKDTDLKKLNKSKIREAIANQTKLNFNFNKELFMCDYFAELIHDEGHDDYDEIEYDVDVYSLKTGGRLIENECLKRDLKIEIGSAWEFELYYNKSAKQFLMYEENGNNIEIFPENSIIDFIESEETVTNYNLDE